MIGTLIVLAICAAIAGIGYAAPSALNLLFDGLDMALGWMGPFLTVTVLSAVTGVLFILAFPHVSAQGAIVAVKDRIKHNLLGIRIFQDDMPTVGKGVVGALFWNICYLALNILPMAVMAAPFMYIWFQLNALYAYQPLETGERTTIVAEFDPSVKAHEVQVELPDGLELVQRGNTQNKVVLVVDAVAEGSHELSFASGATTVTKSVEVATNPRRLARLRTSEPLTKFTEAKDPIVYFGDPVLPATGPVRTITVPYEVRPLGFLSGGEISIMLWFVVVSLAVGFGLKGVFGVEI
ncbi:MAG: hypothetical protein CMJ94_06495 [Planctomycetes bacterium]|nr:hypothetical protein [Planctomycetota bacterium]